jgi:hypothetical protein
MNKNAIQKYAVWARNELIEQVKQRAFQYGISEKGYGEENAPVVNGRVLSPEEKRQRHEFVAKIHSRGELLLPPGSWLLQSGWTYSDSCPGPQVPQCIQPDQPF